MHGEGRPRALNPFRKEYGVSRLRWWMAGVLAAVAGVLGVAAPMAVAGVNGQQVVLLTWSPLLSGGNSNGKVQICGENQHNTSVCSPITALPQTQPFELHNWWFKGPLTIHEWTYSGQEVSGPCISPQDGQTHVAVPQTQGSSRNDWSPDTFDCDADFGPSAPFLPPQNPPASITVNAYANPRWLNAKHPQCPSSASISNLPRARKASLRNGQTIALCGSVSQPVPAGGATIVEQELPTNAKGKPIGPWRTFNAVQTDSSGHYTALYGFQFTAKLHTYPIRAVVPRQDGYAYLPNNSRVVSITVTG